MDKRKLKIKIVIIWPVAFVILAAALFLPAGTFLYWQAWVYMAVLFIPAALVMGYLLKHDPELLERRIRMKERIQEQDRIMKVSYLPFILMFIIPGLDKRYGWSDVAPAVVILADILILSGYALFVATMLVNSYASRIIEVTEGQKVVTTGPYAFVRHPMYVAVLAMYLSTPVALGSWWALIPAVFIIPVIVARLLNEEKVLSQELEGYREYMFKTRYRLLPGIW